MIEKKYCEMHKMVNQEVHYMKNMGDLSPFCAACKMSAGHFSGPT